MGLHLPAVFPSPCKLPHQHSTSSCFQYASCDTFQELLSEYKVQISGGGNPGKWQAVTLSWIGASSPPPYFQSRVLSYGKPCPSQPYLHHKLAKMGLMGKMTNKCISSKAGLFHEKVGGAGWCLWWKDIHYPGWTWGNQFVGIWTDAPTVCAASKTPIDQAPSLIIPDPITPDMVTYSAPGGFIKVSRSQQKYSHFSPCRWLMR